MASDFYGQTAQNSAHSAAKIQVQVYLRSDVNLVSKIVQECVWAPGLARLEPNSDQFGVANRLMITRPLDDAYILSPLTTRRYHDDVLTSCRRTHNHFRLLSSPQILTSAVLHLLSQLKVPFSHIKESRQWSKNVECMKNKTTRKKDHHY